MIFLIFKSLILGFFYLDKVTGVNEVFVVYYFYKELLDLRVKGEIFFFVNLNFLV